MLDLMRKHAGTWIIKFILGAIVVVFVFWGVGSYTSQRSVRVARVNGETISLDEFRDSYNRLLDQMRRSFGNNLNDELIRSLQLEKQALDQLIDRRLMLQAAAELKIRVTDEELVNAIRGIDAFQSDGVFDAGRYRRVLDLNRLSPENFESGQRQAMMVEKLGSLITGSVQVSDIEIAAWYARDNAAVDLNYLLFEPQRYQKIEPEPAKVQAYFDEHKETYKTEPRRQAKYVRFDTQRFLPKVAVTDDEIAEYYQANLDAFNEPKTVEARHILLKVDPQADEAEVERVRQRAADILKMVRAGKDFAELAEEYSEGPSKDRGGYLGAFRYEVMVKPFADAAFAMQAGEVSEPVRTQFGWHLIKVEKVNAAKTRTLAEARPEIVRKLSEERARNMAYDEAEAAFESVFDGNPLEAVASARSLAVETTGFFGRQGPASGVGNGAQFAQTVFELPIGEISEIKDLGDGYYLIEAAAEDPAHIPALAEVAERVKADLVAELQREAAAKDAAAALEALKAGESLAEVAKKRGVPVKTTGFFKRNDAAGEIGREPAVVAAAFELSADSKWPPEAIDTAKGYYVLEFREAKNASMEELAQQQDAIRQRLLQQKQYQAMEAWLKARRENSEIDIEPEYRKG